MVARNGVCRSVLQTNSRLPFADDTARRGDACCEQGQRGEIEYEHHQLDVAEREAIEVEKVSPDHQVQTDVADKPERGRTKNSDSRQTLTTTDQQGCSCQSKNPGWVPGPQFRSYSP